MPEVNKTYLGTVQRIADFGAFVEIMPGTDGLLHVSEIAEYRVANVRDELEEGQQLLVKVINVDPSGKIRLSRKAVLREERGRLPKSQGPSADDEGRGDRHASRRSWPSPRRRPPPESRPDVSSSFDTSQRRLWEKRSIVAFALRLGLLRRAIDAN